MREESGYEPDIIVLNEQTIGNEPRWEKSSIITMGSSVPLIVEVTSTDWGDGYALKLEQYETMGMQEYWIIDYLGWVANGLLATPNNLLFRFTNSLTASSKSNCSEKARVLSPQLSQNWSWQRSRCSPKGIEEAAYAAVRVGVSD